MKPFQFGLWRGSTGRRGFRRVDSVACILADTLAYAAARNVPFALALRALPFYREDAFVRRWLRFLNRWPFNRLALHPACWARDFPLCLRVRELIEELEKGEPLSFALENTFGMFFPSCFILALEKAENEGSVATALPVLAEMLNYPRLVRRERRIAVQFAAVRLVVAVSIASALNVFILPRYAKMMHEFGAAYTGVGAMNLIATVLGVVLHWGFCLWVLYYVLTRVEVVREAILLRVPFGRRDVQRQRTAELTRALLAFVNTGSDLHTAAEWAQRATRSPWLSARVRVFTDALSRGVGWAEAWQAMELDLPAADWLVCNAAAREDPGSGLELLLDKLLLDIDSTTRRWQALADPVCVLVLAVFVGGMCYSMFNCLVRLNIIAIQM